MKQTEKKLRLINMSDVNEWPETGCKPFRLTGFKCNSESCMEKSSVQRGAGAAPRHTDFAGKV
jgi:hypothetical protein